MFRFSRAYDFLLFVLTRGRPGAYYRDIAELAEVAPGDRHLDVGCGTGSLALASMQRTQPGGSVTGVDLSPQMLATARRKIAGLGLDIAFDEGDAAALPFQNDSFDVVTFTTAMHAVPEARRRECLSEAARVLAPEGRLLLVDWAGEPDLRDGWIAKVGPHRRFDLETLRDPLSEEGFVRIEDGPVNWLGLHYLRGTMA